MDCEGVGDVAVTIAPTGNRPAGEAIVAGLQPCAVVQSNWRTSPDMSTTKTSSRPFDMEMTDTGVPGGAVDTPPNPGSARTKPEPGLDRKSTRLNSSHVE